jgi:hypothetical protein
VDEDEAIAQSSNHGLARGAALGLCQQAQLRAENPTISTAPSYMGQPAAIAEDIHTRTFWDFVGERSSSNHGQPLIVQQTRVFRDHYGWMRVQTMLARAVTKT